MTDLVYLRQNSALVTRVLDGEAVIMDPTQGKVMALNAVGSLIWEMIDGTHTKEDILNEICLEFMVGREEAVKDLDDFLAVLEAKELIVNL